MLRQGPIMDFPRKQQDCLEVSRLGRRPGEDPWNFCRGKAFLPASTAIYARFSVAKAKRARSRRARHYQQPPASRLFDDALALASTLADSRKRAGADRIVELASATREFGASLDDFPQLRRYSDAAAKNLDDLADYVAATDIPDMLDDFASFAKRQPIATLTLGVAAGLAFTQRMHGWPVPTKTGRKSSNGGGRRRRRQRKALN